MTAFAASFFALAACVAVLVVVKTWMEYGGAARSLRAQLRACPETRTITWSVIERPFPHGEAQHGKVVTMGQAARPDRRLPAQARVPVRQLDLAA